MNYSQTEVENRIDLRSQGEKVAIGGNDCVASVPGKFRNPMFVRLAAMPDDKNGGNFPSGAKGKIVYYANNYWRNMFIAANSHAALNS